MSTQWNTEPCRECGRATIWALDQVGALVALDAEPQPTGKLKLYVGPSGETRCGVLRPDHLRFGRRDLRVPHDTLCKARKWSRKR